MKTLFFRGAMRLSMAMLVVMPTVCLAAGQTQQAQDVTGTRALLANPRVGDLYAAELTAFSGVNFNAGDEGQEQMNAAYGLLKVIKVDHDTVTVITEMSAWPNPQGARNDLRGDLQDITWDQDEEIPLYRAELPSFHNDGKIVEARRLSSH
ncbi:MAG: hypothetical protein LBL59_02125 [Xanthomonadaceae bacterium]|jgi:hypothetical protein|nr:hypothetical protein [Xanthomonadaceae bacterium]